ncbi:hypothetical protein LZ31DRAFT_561181 [Colletotrichum somersetense]|nr:hypothetical protein LZ31DRAFT_561181 [Colletotrichum somersetense]
MQLDATYTQTHVAEPAHTYLHTHPHAITHTRPMRFAIPSHLDPLLSSARLQNNLEDASGIRLDGPTANGLSGNFQCFVSSPTLAHAQAKGSRPAQRPT